MLRLLRRAYRYLFPRRLDPWLDQDLSPLLADPPFEAAYRREVVTAGGGPGGPILLTTPPRWRYALRPDPHFGLRGLALLPPAWQRSVAARRGFAGPHHYVHRLYGSAAQVARLFPGCRLARVLSRSRAPGRWF
jgi:hypothetical protein